MKTVVVMEGQTLTDIAIQVCGAPEAVCELAVLNGIEVTEVLTVGRVLRVPERVYNAKVAEVYALNGLKPATEVEKDVCGVFSKEFNSFFS